MQLTSRTVTEMNPCDSTQWGPNRQLWIQGRETMEHVSPGATPCMPTIVETGHEAHERKTLRYKPGDYIIKEGEFSIVLYLIVNGTVSILKKLHGEEVLLFELGPGDVFGEMVFNVGSHVPCTESAVAKDAVEVEAWHYLALWFDYQKMRPIIQLLAVDMLGKIEKISEVHDRLRLEKLSKTPDGDVNLTVHEPSCTFKLVDGEPVGTEWKGLIEYRVPDNPEPAFLRATGIDIDEEWIRFDIPVSNMNHGAHVLGRIDMMIHLAGGAPVKVWGEIVSIAQGAMVGHTACRVRFCNVTPEAHQRIEPFLTTRFSRKEGA